MQKNVYYSLECELLLHLYMHYFNVAAGKGGAIFFFAKYTAGWLVNFDLGIILSYPHCYITLFWLIMF